MSRSRNVLDVRASLKVGLQMEQDNFPPHKMSSLGIEPGSLDKAVVHVGGLNDFHVVMGILTGYRG